MEDNKPGRASAPKQIKCRVVRNYGNHRPGAVITVEEREYLRLRDPVLDADGEPTGEFTFPWLVTDTDGAIVAKREQDAKEAKQKAMRPENEIGPGWAKHEAEALAIVRARAADRLRQQKEEEERLLREPKLAATA